MFEHQIERYARISAIVVLIVGCFLVLRPFIAAIALAAIVCMCTWPAYQRLLRFCKQRVTLSALIMTLGLVIMVIVPLSLLAASLTNAVPMAVQAGHDLLNQGAPAPPDWLSRIPAIGQPLLDYWQRVVQNREELNNLGSSLVLPARTFLFATVRVFGDGIVQLTLVVFVCFFLYRDGVYLAGALRTTVKKLAGDMGDSVLSITHGTVLSVMFGMVGTAAAQAFLALVGFLIAGVPAAFLLGAAVFFLSMVPVGPPLVWGGAAIWLYMQGEPGWAIFMVLWGALLVSTIDNFLKPILISRGSNLSFALVFLGVLGGALAFGFIGIFLGPTLLAVGLTVFNEWTRTIAAQPVPPQL